MCKRYFKILPLTAIAASMGLIMAIVSASAFAQGERAPQLASQGHSNELPTLGDAGIMTPPQERRFGDLIAKDLYADTTSMDDPVLSEYLDRIWRRLLVAAQQRGLLSPELNSVYSWRFAIMRDSEVNAFSMPGGYMGINLGLISSVQTTDELAAVIAHESSHIIQRHIARLIATQGREQPLMLAAIIAGIIAGARNPQIGSAVIAGGQATMLSRQLSFSRDMEREADRIGYSIFVQAGYQPWGFVSMFEKLQAASRLNDNGDWPLLRTHPLTTQRIADMQERERSLASRPKPLPDWEALLMAARARVLARPGVDILHNWAREPLTTEFDKQPDYKRAAILYSAALSLAELRDFSKAQQMADALTQLTANHPGADATAKLLKAEIALKAGQPFAALSYLPRSSQPKASVQTHKSNGAVVLEISDAGLKKEGASSDTSTASDQKSSSYEGRAALMLRASAQLATNQASQIRQGASEMQIWVNTHPLDGPAWGLLASLNRALSLQLRSLRAQGEESMANLDYTGAIDRWRAAQDYSRMHQSSSEDLIEASIVNSRIEAARQALKRQKETQKKYS